VKQEEERFIYNVLNMISSVQFNGFENTLLLAARHSSPSVRRQAVELLGNARVTEAEKELVKMAQYDSDFGVKESALYALSIMKSQEGLNLCQSLLRSGDRNNKYKAWRCLAAWEDDSDAVELMQKYKNDPDVGQQIKAHLGRYGK
jgi:HEAT repeat protein